YVDIEGHKIIRFEPTTGQETVWNVGERVGTVVPRGRGGLTFAGDHGFSFLDVASGEVTRVIDLEADVATNRFNDGKCDPAGRFWAGSMHLGPKREATGSLYALQADLSVDRKFGPVTVSNGIVWTKDAQTMYYIDTPRKNVLAFDFDAATGDISNERVAFGTSEYLGSPDGMAIDAEDRLWIAFCHGSAVRCFDPSTGRSEAELLFPCREVTACAFGGAELEDLYVTTGIPGADVEPTAGRLFVVPLGVKGVPATAFAG
ncbi:MAG: SMP-30/gluconolactonase/LRE family protein, partial [Roseimicrobium sp.]